MRAFQLKAQRNITIVDLDDDNEETDNTKNDKEKKTKEAVNDKAADNEDKKEDKEKEDAEKMSVETTKDIEKKNAGEKENKSEKSEETVSEDVEMADASKKKKDDEVESQTADATTAEKKSDTPPKTHQDGDIKVPEPTLFELLNWLDNPPEDITFVSEFCITLDDFVEAVKVVQPSAKREGFITVPDVTWDDVGSLQDIREELKLAVLAPVKFPEKLARLGLSAPSGVLLCGPPGCGKTLLAKAIANEAGINFISVKGPELMNMV